MPEMNLKQPEFTYSPCGLFTKNKKRIQKLKETGNTKYIYSNEFVFTMICLKEILKIYQEEQVLIKHC